MVDHRHARRCGVRLRPPAFSRSCLAALRSSAIACQRRACLALFTCLRPPRYRKAAWMSDTTSRAIQRSSLALISRRILTLRSGSCRVSPLVDVAQMRGIQIQGRRSPVTFRRTRTPVARGQELVARHSRGARGCWRGATFFRSGYVTLSKSLFGRVRGTFGFGTGPDVLKGPFGGVELALNRFVTLLGSTTPTLSMRVCVCFLCRKNGNPTVSLVRRWM